MSGGAGGGASEPGRSPFAGLERQDKLRLLRFACALAWADLTVQEPERELFRQLVDAMGFEGADRTAALGWLRRPPRPEEVDPQDVPPEHRQLFLEAARSMVERDGVVARGEAESLELLEKLLA